MKILAVDSSGLVASVAVIEDDSVLAEYTINYKKTHSQTLLPMIDEITKNISLDLNTLDAIAVAGGPGSFTGLRIGSATVKGLGLVLEKPIISVPTVDALAYQMYGVSGVICPLMDARRQQVYTGIYRFPKEGFQIIQPQCAISAIEMIERLNQLGEPVIFLGDGVPVNKELIEQNCKTSYSIAPPFASRQRAAALGVLACQYYAEGKTETPVEHKPNYLRLSQAERERLEKNG